MSSPPASLSLLEIGWRAASLAERLAANAGFSAEPPSNDPAQAAALAAWRQASSGGDEAAFARRLAWDGLDTERILRALSAEPPLAQAPAWTEWLPRFLVEGRSCAEELHATGSLPELDALDPATEPPFVELWVAYLRSARRVLHERAGDSLARMADTARVSFEAQLLAELARSSELAVYERFQAFREAGRGGYATYVRSLLRSEMAELYSTYPGLARQQARLVETWVDSSLELLARLRADRAAVTRTFGGGRDPGPVVAAEVGLSDRHHGGRRVCVLHFASGLGLVYKPRDVGLEHAYNRLLLWLREHGLAASPPSLTLLPRDGYGWVERVVEGRFESRDEVARYFRRAGCLTMVVHVLRGRDLHNENVVASREGPVLVDTEALVQPVDRSEEPPAVDAISRVADRQRRSCLATGLLSFLQIDAQGSVYDIGGLREGGARRAPIARRVWRALRQDHLHFVRDDRAFVKVQNHVRLGGVLQPPEAFAADFAAGFDEAYGFLLDRREELLAPGGPLGAFETERTRLLFRPSDQYAALLHVLAAPAYQRLGYERSFAQDALNRVFRRERARPSLWALVGDEQRALFELDVPRLALATTSTTPVSERGESVPGHFLRSGLDAVRDRLRELSSVDRKDQLEMLEAALGLCLDHAEIAACAVASDAAPPTSNDEATPVRAAVKIGEEFLARAVRGEDGALAWLGAGDVRLESMDPRAGRLDLYDGLPGGALFLASLARLTGEERWARASRGVIRSVAPALERAEAGSAALWPGVGACSGPGSTLYALVLLAGLLEDGALVDLAARLARQLTASRIAAEPRLDVEGGAAGALLALLALHEKIAEGWVLEAARACARHLLERQVATGREDGGWPAPDGLMHAGFAHGAGGIACALARLHERTGDGELLSAARRGLRYERAIYSPADRNWPLQKKNGGSAVMTAWCHGAAGVALSRALVPASFLDDELVEELELALATTESAPQSRFDHLCCGNLGRADVLLTAGLRRHQDARLAAAAALARAVAARAVERGRLGVRPAGFESGAFRPGFFQGLSGIGYELLRVAAPRALPSVLGFEAGTGGEA